jgi:Protein of unknown function (DUF3102)
MAKPGTNRTLEVLTGELNSALMRKTADKIALGGLFAEAKKEVGHGHWLKYLKENFSLSDTTVASYIKIYQGAAKLPNFGNLKIASHLLDKLFVYSPKRGFAPEVRAAIFEEAKTKWVGWERAHEIERGMQRADDEAYRAEIKSIERGDPLPWEATETEAPAEAAPVTALADVRPPVAGAISLSPKPPISQRDTRETGRRAQFQEVIQKLKSLMTRPANEFAGVTSKNELREIIDFLNMVAERTPAEDVSRHAPPSTANTKHERGNDVPTGQAAEEMKQRLAALDISHDPEVTKANDLTIPDFLLR